MLAINGRSLTQHSFASDDTNRRLAHHALRPHTLSRHNHVRRSRLADGRGAQAELSNRRLVASADPCPCVPLT